MSDNKEGCATVLGMMLAFAAIFIASLLLYAWATMTLWGWFVVPLGGPAVGMTQAYGLTLIVRLFRSGRTMNKRRQNEEKEERKRLGNAVWLLGVAANALLPPLVAVGLGWFVLWL